jgi:proline utilization trans-activator
MGPAIDPHELESNPNCLEKAYAIFDEMIRDGNQVASFRRSELQQLDDTLLGCISGDHPRQLTVPAFFQQADIIPNPASPSATPIPGAMSQSLRYDDAVLRPDSELDLDCDFSTMLTSAEIMAVADSIESHDTEWVSNAMIEHSIW